MHWLAFGLISMLALILQASLATRLELLGARPDWLLVVVVFFAMHADFPDSLIGAWLVGLIADLFTIERFGLLAGSYALAAWLVASARGYLYLKHWLTHWVGTAVAAALIQGLWLAYRCCVYPALDPFALLLVRDVLMSALYTGAWAVVMQGVLLRHSKWLGVRGRSHRWTAVPRGGMLGV